MPKKKIIIIKNIVIVWYKVYIGERKRLVFQGLCLIGIEKST